MVHPGPEALARAAAGEAAAVLRQTVADRGEANAMFATGNSQLAFVEALVDLDDVPWDRVVVFHMDEYVGIGPAHPASFRRWIRDRIELPTRPAAAHYLDGLAPDPEAECARYGALLRARPLDLCCLGIGENGHLAFNDPPADFDDPLDVKIVTLDDACRRQQVGEGHFPTVDAVPARALTVTVPALLRAPRVLAVVPDARKAVAVARALLGTVHPSCPASALRRHPGVTVHLDPASAAGLGWEIHAPA